MTSSKRPRGPWFGAERTHPTLLQLIVFYQTATHERRAQISAPATLVWHQILFGRTKKRKL
jgi:hypothetical protein